MWKIVGLNSPSLSLLSMSIPIFALHGVILAFDSRFLLIFAFDYGVCVFLEYWALVIRSLWNFKLF